MPKHSVGPRPVGVLAPSTRVLYSALVHQLQGALPEPSRNAKFADHESYGTSPEESRQYPWIIDIDIVACYEYINHNILADELLLQSLNEDAVSGLRRLLGELFPRGYGIPQSLKPSHQLADAYLDRITRGLLRHGYALHRYADDFRILARSLSDAQNALETAAEEARRVGLALSSKKLDSEKRPT